MTKLIIKYSDFEFPDLLKEMSDCPKKLYCVGNVELLKSKKIISVVGSRNMSVYGKKVIGELVGGLVKDDWVIVSGMAYGVDSEVHRKCVQNKGKTIAVLASGADIATPKGNSEIYRQRDE